MHSRLLVPALALAAFAASTAAAQTVINSVPYTITTPGKYVLGGNLITDSAVDDIITINASNVILDLNGFFVSGPANTPASTAAVIVVFNVSNVTIRNGTVANCGYGILFGSGANSINHLVEGINVTRCYQSGITFGNTAGSLVRRCRLSQLGGTSFQGFDVHGIFTAGGVRIEKNSITGVTDPSGSASSFGIRMSASSFAIGNTVSGCAIGVQGGKYQRNLTFNCTTTFSAGTDAGGNN